MSITDDLVHKLFTSTDNLGNEKYEIEFHDEVNAQDGKRIKKIQGAKVIGKSENYIHHFDYELNSDVEVKDVRFLISNNDIKLSNIFDTTPYGILNKTRTGIGATTLELKSKRNSIIVVPTQSLALNKVESSKNKKTGKYQYLYVGGRIDGKKFPTIEEYLKDDKILYKKFIVVADSFPKLVESLGKELYYKYFFLVDEIDSYQYDSHYRPALENIIDYYFKFPRKKRCMVTATMGFFSHPEIKKEPFIVLDFVNPIQREINLYYTNETARATADIIIKTLKNNPDDKILIAYNAISRGILRVIALLDDELKRKCSILCSVKSNNYIEDYLPENELENKLSSQINFMTCTYFVGIDIEERYHLISVSDANVGYSLLSEEKFIQILGRCRDKKGVLSETIIYSTKSLDLEKRNKTLENWKIFYDVEPYNTYTAKYREVLKQDANLIVNCQTDFNKITKKYRGLKDDYALTNKEVIEKVTRFEDGRIISIIRENIYGQLKPSYFNIDSLEIQDKLKSYLYLNPDNLKRALEISGNTVKYDDTLQYNLEDKEVQKKYKQIEIENEEKNELELGEVIDQLRKCKPENRRSEAGKIRVKKNTSIGVFLERFVELEQYVPFEELVNHLSDRNNRREYKRFFNSVIIWALDNKHALKLKITEEFKIGERYTNDEIAEKVSKIFNSVLGIKIIKRNSAIEKAKYLVNLSKKRERGKQTSYRYEVISYNVNDFKGEPLTVISDGEFVKKQLKL